jgi:hypothetical protein
MLRSALENARHHQKTLTSCLIGSQLNSAGLLLSNACARNMYEVYGPSLIYGLWRQPPRNTLCHWGKRSIPTNYKKNSFLISPSHGFFLLSKNGKIKNAIIKVIKNGFYLVNIIHLATCFSVALYFLTPGDYITFALYFHIFQWKNTSRRPSLLPFLQPKQKGIKNSDNVNLICFFLCCASLIVSGREKWPHAPFLRNILSLSVLLPLLRCVM